LAVVSANQFTFLGIRVCSIAFQDLSGVSAGALQTARESVKVGLVSSHSLKELGAWMGIRSNGKPSRYLELQLLQMFFAFRDKITAMPLLVLMYSSMLDVGSWLLHVSSSNLTTAVHVKTAAQSSVFLMSCCRIYFETQSSKFPLLYELPRMLGLGWNNTQMPTARSHP